MVVACGSVRECERVACGDSMWGWVFACISMHGWMWMCCIAIFNLMHTFNGTYVCTYMICCMVCQKLHIYLQELWIKCHILMKSCHKH